MVTTERPLTCTPSIPPIDILDSGTGELELIDMDVFEFEDALQVSKMSANISVCRGYALIFPGGQSPHDSYLFALHNHLELP